DGRRSKGAGGFEAITVPLPPQHQGLGRRTQGVSPPETTDQAGSELHRGDRCRTEGVGSPETTAESGRHRDQGGGRWSATVAEGLAKMRGPGGRLTLAALPGCSMGSGTCRVAGPPLAEGYAAEPL